MNLIPLAIQYPCEFNTPLENLWGFLFSICYACIVLLNFCFFLFLLILLYMFKNVNEMLKRKYFCFFLFFVSGARIFLLCLKCGNDTTTTKLT